MSSTTRNLHYSEETSKSQTLSIFMVISFLLHLFFLLFSLFVLKSNTHYIHSIPYTVNLVSLDSTPLAKSEAQTKDQKGKEEPLPRREIVKSQKSSSPITEKKSEKSSRIEEEYITERIEAIKAKRRIEKIAGLRNIISVQSGGHLKKNDPKESARGKGTGSFPDDYISKITQEIWQEWIYPDTGKKTLEAIIVIRILKDGSVQIKGIEKSSGDSLFDRSALRAITKASPLTPPPHEMEIGVRFYP